MIIFLLISKSSVLLSNIWPSFPLLVALTAWTMGKVDGGSCKIDLLHVLIVHRNYFLPVGIANYCFFF